jgi:probable HAF family extracellular repeat protein
MIALGGLPGGDIWSIANGVSTDGGVIVGQARIGAADHAFRWTQATGMVALSLPTNGRSASAFSVSSDGSIVVGRVSIAQPDPAEGQDMAFRWTEATGMVGLGDLPGGRVTSTAHATSADGSVIVGTGETFFEEGVGATNEAFFWTAQSGMLNLRDALISSGATGLDGWLLTEASGVSADGLTIVGTATDPNGVSQAFVATIPEPSTFVLAALDAIVVGALFLRQRFAVGALQRN